ncbi:MAG: hypothetical protein OIF32_08730 [Campylobacterales bacterium]|nr:hypothetical protein [Campylobacterales bacterium]
MHKFQIYRDMIDIDYYVYFSKAYFAFNAYLKAKYPDLSDIDKIKKIKDEGRIQRKFRNLIDDGKHFKDDLRSLHIALDNAQIENRGEFILFNKVKLYDHRVAEIYNDRNRVDYLIRAIDGEKFIFNVNGIASTPFKYEELDEILNNTELTEPQKRKIKEKIIGYVETYSVDLRDDIRKLLEFEELGVGEQQEVETRIYRGFVEIAYSLRNALFHSEVEPNSDVMKVYKFAYFILRKIVKAIPTN